MSAPRFFEGSDGSCHRYLVPFEFLAEWNQWCELPEDDEASWEAPEWAQRIDGGLLTFTDPRIES